MSFFQHWDPLWPLPIKPIVCWYHHSRFLQLFGCFKCYVFFHCSCKPLSNMSVYRPKLFQDTLLFQPILDMMYIKSWSANNVDQNCGYSGCTIHFCHFIDGVNNQTQALWLRNDPTNHFTICLPLFHKHALFFVHYLSSSLSAIILRSKYFQLHCLNGPEKLEFGKKRWAMTCPLLWPIALLQLTPTTGQW